MAKLQIDVHIEDVVRALDTYGDVAQPFLNEAARDSAESIEREAVLRLRRQLGPNATGETEAGIESRPAYDGNGYVVISSNDRMPNLPLWIDDGTTKGKPRSHTEPARPYFYVSAALEEGAHVRRVEDALIEAASVSGLGE